MKRNSTVIAVVIVFVLIIICCICLAVLAGIGLWFTQEGVSSFPWVDSTSTQTPFVVRPTPGEVPAATAAPSPTPAPGETPDPTSTPLAGSPANTLQILQNATVPPNDPFLLAQRLNGEEEIPATLPPLTEPYRVGAQKTFWAANGDTNQNFQVQAILRYETEHSYFWVQDGVRYDQDELKQLAETFENQIYPTNREFFGSEWTPGVDGDPHLYILYARGLGNSVAGYFSSLDSYPPSLRDYSNGHEMFLLSADNVDLGEEYAYGVLAHEFQHMIHWHRDRDESRWLNEGFSDLAMLLNGYSIGGHDYLYSLNPDLQLNDWPTHEEQSAPNYGAAFLFVTYLLDRFGEEATKAVVGEPANGLESIDKVLAELGAVDPATGQPLGADDLFVDWVIANYVNDPSVPDGRYTYENYSRAPQVEETESIATCPMNNQVRDVRQYGVDYIRIRCPGDYTLRFEGSIQVQLVPTDPYSGSYAFWSNKGDEADMTLTREFDFTGDSGPLTFTYWTWYDLEEDFDYLYLLASADGEPWEMLRTPSGTDADPTGANYGWGYNGASGNSGSPQWIQEEVDLTRFAGQKVQLRFEYITDAGVNGEGFLLDDVAIPEIGYASDFEQDDGGWEPAGWVRVENFLPQTFSLALITRGEETRVEYIPLSGDVSAEIPLELGGDVEEAILVVTGTTRYTRQPAAYQFRITE